MVSATALSPDRRVYISVDADSTVSKSGVIETYCWGLHGF